MNIKMEHDELAKLTKQPILPVHLDRVMHVGEHLNSPIITADCSFLSALSHNI